MKGGASQKISSQELTLLGKINDVSHVKNIFKLIYVYPCPKCKFSWTEQKFCAFCKKEKLQWMLFKTHLFFPSRHYKCLFFVKHCVHMYTFKIVPFLF